MFQRELEFQQLIEIRLLPCLFLRCMAAAQRHFSLDEGVARYNAIYHSLDRN